MNKKILLLGLLLPLIAGCTGREYISPVPYVPNPDQGGSGGGGEGGGGGGGGGGGQQEEFNLTVYFFLDFSHSEVFEDPETEELLPRDKYPTNAIYKMQWYALEPLKEMPAEAALTDSMAADPQYPHFIGYSRYSSCLDESLLWNWETDSEATNTLNLYGVWVSQ